MKIWLKTPALVLLAALLVCSAVSQTASSENKVTSGGGLSTNAHFSISGTIAPQDATATLHGTRYSISGAFSGLISVIQTPGAPPLIITQSSNTIRVSWQKSSLWSLQQSSSLESSAQWTPNSRPITTANGTNSISITLPAETQFFRLNSL